MELKNSYILASLFTAVQLHLREYFYLQNNMYKINWPVFLFYFIFCWASGNRIHPHFLSYCYSESKQKLIYNSNAVPFVYNNFLYSAE